MGRLAVNVDVDGLDLYHQIHGLPVPAASDSAWELGVRRFLALFDELGVKATLFVVARDLERAIPKRVAAEAVAAGHELASHTFSHPYDLVRMSPRAVAGELERAEGLIGDLRGSAVAGFRAPGYNISRPILRVLAERGYVYDSSAFPCPPYYAAKAAIIGGIRLRGRQSRSIIGDPRAAFGRRRPHRLVAAGGLLEYPITVLPGLRFPLIGTSLTLLGVRGVQAIGPVLRRLRFVNLEFHALDLMGEPDLPGSPLIGHQPDLRTPVSAKRRAFASAIALAAAESRNDTLEAFARAFPRSGHG